MQLFHGTQAKHVRTHEIRPSKTGVFGPGIYTTKRRDHAAQYGDNVHMFEIPFGARFVSAGEFDRLNRSVGSGEKTALKLREQGFAGVQDGDVHVLWLNPAKPPPERPRLQLI